MKVWVGKYCDLTIYEHDLYIAVSPEIIVGNDSRINVYSWQNESNDSIDCYLSVEECQRALRNNVYSLKAHGNDITICLPELGSLWQHKNGNIYHVYDLTNINLDRMDEYPPRVSYNNVDTGIHYSRDWDKWLTGSFEKRN